MCIRDRLSAARTGKQGAAAAGHYTSAESGRRPRILASNAAPIQEHAADQSAIGPPVRKRKFDAASCAACPGADPVIRVALPPDFDP
eukprot:7488182-Alexandrium_andersonii.AAC.1